jgi:16S rRNA processing protein RimM
VGPESVIVGVIAKPIGLKGEVFVRPDPDLDYAPAPGDVYDIGDGRRLEVAASREHSGRRVMRFVGIDTREAVETLRGTILRVPRHAVPLEEDAFWSEDLLGREVTDDTGSLVGVIEATLDGAAHDYLVIARPDGGEVMVPAVAELVEVGPEHIVVHAVPGLIDDDAW